MQLLNKPGIKEKKKRLHIYLLPLLKISLFYVYGRTSDLKRNN
jgi:hypothetical protein